MMTRFASVSAMLLLCGLVSVSAQTESPHGSESTLLSDIRQLTFEGRRSGEGYFNADGTQMVFQSEREADNPFYQIYRIDLETGDTDRVSPGHGKTTCSWAFPDGQRVLYASTHEDPEARAKQKAELEFRASGKERRYSWDYDQFFELYVTDLESGETRRLTDATGYDAEAAVSPDGAGIVFSSNRAAYTDTLSEHERTLFETDKSYFVDLYMINADGSGLRRLTTTPGYDGGPFFSADGSKICWRRFSEDGMKAEVYVMNSDGSDPRQITELGGMSWAPFFHPSGEYLIFTTNLHGFGNFELYLVDVEGESEPVRVTYTDGFDGLPSFSPDGQTLAWTSNRTASGQSQIFMAGWNHGEARRLLGLDQLLSTVPAIDEDDLRSHVEQLASDEMEGRLTGSEGERLATSYAAGILRSVGIQPAGDEGGWFQEFEYTSGVSLGPTNRMVIQGKEEYQARIDEEWRPLAFSRTDETGPAPVVFAGYGIVAPAEGDHEEYDSYVHLDVEGKWVLIFRYLPENVTPERRQHLAPYSGLRYKAMAARERGAVGLLVVSGPNSQVENQLTELTFDASLGSISLAVASISDDLGQLLLSAAGKDLAEVQGALDTGEPSMGYALGDLEIVANVDIVQKKSRGRNVVGSLSASSLDSEGEPALVIGAHIDHLGRGRGMSTLAREDERNEIHYGADDNASGVAGLLEIAEYLADQVKRGRMKPRRNVIFALWSGEELGLLGSSHFVQSVAAAPGNPSDISQTVAAYLNMDMIGRLKEKLILQGVGSSSLWPSEIEKRNAPVGLAIATQNDSYLPTDATSFYLKRVPILSAFTGTHSEYHSPRDTADRLNYDGLEKISRFMGLVARSLAATSEEPDYQEMKRPSGEGGRARLRAYLGTIPDYAQGDIVGVKLGGVVAGGPAEETGLRGGDVIVELAGRKIENIYDYTYAIEALKIGETVTVVVERNGERLSLALTPGSRE